jgi:hypothetical protein
VAARLLSLLTQPCLQDQPRQLIAISQSRDHQVYVQLTVCKQETIIAWLVNMLGKLLCADVQQNTRGHFESGALSLSRAKSHRTNDAVDGSVGRRLVECVTKAVTWIAQVPEDGIWVCSHDTRASERDSTVPEQQRCGG